jgi:hypothetical protein
MGKRGMSLTVTPEQAAADLDVDPNGEVDRFSFIGPGVKKEEALVTIETDPVVQVAVKEFQAIITRIG